MSVSLPSSTAISVRNFGVLWRDGGDAGCELAVVDKRHQVRVVEEVGELGLDVAVVDVDWDGANLVRREPGLDVLGAVVEIEADVIASGRFPGTGGSERVG